MDPLGCAQAVAPLSLSPPLAGSRYCQGSRQSSSTLQGKGRGAPKAVTWLVTARSLISPFPRDRNRYSFISKGLEIPPHRGTRSTLRNFATARVGFEREGLAAPATASEGTETRATSAPVPAPGYGHRCPRPFLPPLAANKWGEAGGTPKSSGAQ